MSASAYATFEREAPRVGVTLPAEFADRIAAVRAARRPVTPDAWAQMDMTVRIVLVMIASGQTGAPERIARQPWESFTAADQLAIGNAARMIVSSLKPFAAVA